MDEVKNPYNPGAGHDPAALVGRDQELQTWDIGLQRIEYGNDTQPLVLYGLRGVGKTVLLKHLHAIAQERNWLTVKVEAKSSESLRSLLARKLYPELKRLSKPQSSQKILQALKTALSFKATLTSAGNWEFGIDLSHIGGGAADTGIIENDLTELVKDISLAVADEKGTGLALLIDEAQDLDKEELEAIAATMHEVAQEGYPVALALSGLPSLHAKLAEAKSYSERLFHFMQIDSLDEKEARQALSKPSAKYKVTWEEEAISFVAVQAAGYPYFLQQFGKATWAAAPEGLVIEIVSARQGVEIGLKELDDGFFKTRWDRATNAEKAYMKAMSKDGDAGSRTSDIAERLSQTSQSLGPKRAGLIGKGLIFAPEHGIVQFTVPGMSNFIERQILDNG